MQRTVIYRHEARTQTNVNDEIGLEAYCSYTLKEYLEDLATEEGLTVLAVQGMVHVFSDGSVQILEQRLERIPVEELDDKTRSLVLSAAATRHMPQPVQFTAFMGCA